MPGSLSNTRVNTVATTSVDTDTFHKLPDRDLVELCLLKNEKAWRALLDRYGGLIYSIAWNFNLPAEDVADVFQSVCLTMVEGLRRLNDVTKLSAWVATITRRYCLRAKEGKSSVWANMDSGIERLVDLPDDGQLPDESLQKLEEARILWQAISMLDDPCRRLLTYLFSDQDPMPYDDIARQMNWPVSSIGPRRGRCLTRLKRVLDELGF